MVFKPSLRRDVATLAAAGVIAIALPGGAAMAQKVKTKDPAPAESSYTPTVTIPTIEAVGSSVDDATLMDIFSGNITDNAEALATLNAESITVPSIEISVAEDDPDADVVAFVLSDIVFEDVVDGVASSVTLGGVNLDSQEGVFSLGTMSASNLDIGGILGIYGLVGTDSPTEIKTIYTDFAAEGGLLEAEEVSCTFGAVSGGELRARPLKSSIFDFIAMAESMEDSPEADPALMGQFMHMYADMLTAFETSESSFEGMDCEGTDNDGRPMTFSIGGMSIDAMTPGIYPSFSMDGFSMVVEGDGAFALENFTFKPMDLSQTIATLANAPDLVDEAWLEANYRSLIPAIEGFSFSGLDMDIPDPETEGGRIVASVGGFDLTLGNYINGIPSLIDTSGDSIKLVLPEDSEDEQLQTLIALGLSEINAGFRLAAAWDEASETIGIEEISFTGDDLASVLLAGTINNASADLFGNDGEAAIMAGMNIAVKVLDLTVEDYGLSDLALNIVAAEQNTTPEAMRPMLAGLAEGTIIGMMAEAANAADLSKVVSKFVSGAARTLNIVIEAKNDPGLGLEDMMEAESDPTTLIGKVNISASAE